MKNTISDSTAKIHPVIFTYDNDAIIQYRGEPYHVSVEIVYDDSGLPITCMVSFEKSGQELTKSVNALRNLYYIKWGGCPIFLQQEIWPISDDCVPYEFLCTVNDCWGDSGNCNIFILTRKTENLGYVLERVYMEKSCH